MQRITINQADLGWALASDVTTDEQLFKDSSSAEAAAVKLAESLAECGSACEIVVHRAHGQRALHFLVPALRPVP
jgi:hypothetical protein